ncbi:mucosa-associated lymphoid tissue lymphoma translocation protein 1-like isoform X2 [Acanthaster planci]|nr:mucosa-associated lymphoid tissue lymphoma translocation protein 1-like isoform X2 [Acanthaster planci]
MFALAIHEYYGSPSLNLLRNLGSRGRTVRQLISYLDKMSHEKCLSLLKKPEKLRLLQIPCSQSVQAGPHSLVVLACNAKGFPYPQYCWYRAFAQTSGDQKEVKLEELENETDRVLRISPVREKHSGAYCCKVYHTINGAISQVFTDWAYLEVYPASYDNERDFLDSDEDLEHIAKPEIIQQPPVSLSVRPGKPIKVTCMATGCPTPKYQWYRYGYSSRDGPLEPHALRDQTDKTLYWAQSTTGDQGKYCCRVWNKAGCITSITVSINVDARLAESYPDKIEVVRHPQSISCRIGEPQILACHAAVSQGNLYYQWYHNHQEIPNAKQPEFHFLQVKPEDHGVYQCRVYNEYACVFSNEAMLNISGGLAPPTSNCRFYATDKVALLIGNMDYRSAEQLKAPEGDVENLTKVLSELDFKVVSLLDLNLQEMRFALSAFCDLLNSGVYGLFYFSGHGFESDGQSYLVPVDAGVGYSTKECICDQEVLDLMQYRNTALNTLLLDICRKPNDYPQKDPPEKFRPKVRGNTVFGYAAQTNTQAWEVDGQSSGIFTKYLIKRIRQAKKVSHVLEDVMEDVRNDCSANGIQYPAICHDLNEARSLCDPINPCGHTQEINARSRMWGEAHLLPESPMWVEFAHDIVVCVDLTTRFSNVMLMHTYIPPSCMGESTSCYVKLENFSPELDIKMDKQDVCFEYPSQAVIKMIITTVRNLQRLRGDLECTVTVEGEYRGKPFKQSRPLVISKPLVSNLWQTKHYAVPSEATYPDMTASTE